MSVLGRCDNCGQRSRDAIERPHPDNGNTAVLCQSCFDLLTAEVGGQTDDGDYCPFCSHFYDDGGCTGECELPVIVSEA